ncbi:MAG: hypothetical protein K2W85_09425 [Phycisphaerales bacterium]|nr:hypothetical protein [Phycisphaerales bacterium]
MNPRDRRNKLWQIRDVSDALRSESVPAPDLTRAILDRVDAERPFLAPSVRRRIPWVYASVVMTISACVMAVVLVHRASPTSVQLAREPSPISTLANSVECAACRKLDAIKQSIASDSISAPSPEEFLSTVAAVASVVELENPPFALADRTPSALASGPRSALGVDSQAVAIIGQSPMPTASPAMLGELSRESSNMLRFASASNSQSIVASLPGEPLPRAALFSGELRNVRLGTHSRTPTANELDLFTLPR